MNLTGTIELETERFILRKASKNDAVAMYKNWASDDEVTKYLNWDTHQSLKDSVKILKMWESQYDNLAFFQWIIELKAESTAIGTISLFSVHLKDGSCEIGYCLGRKYWNQGIMSEACHRILGFAFNTVGFTVVYSRHHINNPASGRVMEKNGMKYIGVQEEFSNKTQSIIKTNRYVIRKEEFE
ncbi:MAG: GNAT family N-acetyltransferase [Bacilli bacterium]|nr:GNAT family N-acetyltransferase [Bacilli bacterium]